MLQELHKNLYNNNIKMIKISHQNIIDKINKKLIKLNANEKTINKFKKEIEKIFNKKHFIHIKLKELYKSISLDKIKIDEDLKTAKLSHYELNKEKCKQKAIENYYNNISYYRLYNRLYYCTKKEYWHDYYKNVSKPKQLILKYNTCNNTHIERNTTVTF